MTMLDQFNYDKIYANGQTWFLENVWTLDMAYQGAIVAAAFVIATLLYPILRLPFAKRVENLEAPATMKRIARNLVRLILPATTLLLIFIADIVAGSTLMNMKTGFIDGFMKVLMAWIFIRLAVQFISNAAVRNFFALVIWTIAVLSIVGVLDKTMETLDSFAFSVGDFKLSALVVIKGLLLLFTMLYAAIFISGFAEQRIFKIQSLSRSSQVLIAKITRVALIVIALFMGITAAGIDLSLFAVFGGAIGLGIGFGLQKGISNLFSGMLLLMDKSIKPGDVIEIPDIGTFGWVNNMAARYTEIVTRDNKSYLIPNEDFITQRVINWSHGNSLIRVSLDFGVHYDSDMEQVRDIAVEAAKAPERVVDYRTPVCWMTEFGDSSVNFTVRFWIKDAEEGITNVKGQVYMALWKAFKENGISIPYPHREVYMHDAKS